MSLTSFWHWKIKIISIIYTINITNINVHCLFLPSKINNINNTINTYNIWLSTTCGSGKKYKTVVVKTHR